MQGEKYRCNLKEEPCIKNFQTTLQFFYKCKLFWKVEQYQQRLPKMIEDS